jgi:hypothetical protein
MSGYPAGTRLTCRVCGSAAIVTSASAQAEPACCGEPLRVPGAPGEAGRQPTDSP